MNTPNKALQPTPKSGAAELKRYASKNFVSCVRAFGQVNDDKSLS
jgi:hypothetical protein